MMTAGAVGTEAWTTPRVLGRQWRDDDRAPFAAMNADPRVMAYFAAPLDRAASDAMADRASRAIGERGWGLWAAETRDDGRFIGFVGLAFLHSFVPAFVSHPAADGAAATAVAPAAAPRAAVEIGWRLQPQAWGRGLASEAAAAVLGVAFERLHLPEVVAYTATANARSIAVMRRLGMQLLAPAFEHPQIAAGHPHRTQCLYRIANPNGGASGGTP